MLAQLLRLVGFQAVDELMKVALIVCCGHDVWRRWDCVWIITDGIDGLEAVGDLADVLVCDPDRWGTVLQDHPKFANRPEKLLVEHAEVATACSGVRENPIYVAISVGFAAHGRYGQVQVAEAVYGGIEVAAEAGLRKRVAPGRGNPPVIACRTAPLGAFDVPASFESA